MKPGKILWVMQCFPGDIELAQTIVRFCAELTRHANAGQLSPHADFMLAMRWDCTVPVAFLRELQPTFAKVRTFRCRHHAEGWPQGCNNLASETFQYFVGKQQSKVWDYSGLFLTEADSLPLATDFLARIHREWKSTDKLAMGCHVTSFVKGTNHPGEAHINGNMVIAPELALIAPEVLNSITSIAWDAAHRRELVRYSKPSMTIYSDYELGHEQKNPWRGCDHLFKPVEYFNHHPLRGVIFSPAWLHGCKDPRGLACVRERLLGKEV